MHILILKNNVTKLVDIHQINEGEYLFEDLNHANEVGMEELKKDKYTSFTTMHISTFISMCQEKFNLQL